MPIQIDDIIVDRHRVLVHHHLELGNIPPPVAGDVIMTGNPIFNLSSYKPHSFFFFVLGYETKTFEVIQQGGILTEEEEIFSVLFRYSPDGSLQILSRVRIV